MIEIIKTLVKQWDRWRSIHYGITSHFGVHTIDRRCICAYMAQAPPTCSSNTGQYIKISHTHRQTGTRLTSVAAAEPAGRKRWACRRRRTSCRWTPPPPLEGPPPPLMRHTALSIELAHNILGQGNRGIPHRT